VEKRIGIAAAAALIAFGWLAVAVLRGDAAAFDTSVRDTVHVLASPTLTSVMWAITQLGEAVFLVTFGIIVASWLVAEKRKRDAVWFGAAAVGAEAVDQILKQLVRRPRPEAFFGYPQPETYSVPSGHAMVSLCFYFVLGTILAARVRSHRAKLAIRIGAVVVAFLIGLSRVYLGVHYPTDVLGGYLAAVIWLAALRAAVLKKQPQGSG
jgi:membrane-associated phospholipid phosphatase